MTCIAHRHIINIHTHELHRGPFDIPVVHRGIPLRAATSPPKTLSARVVFDQRTWLYKDTIPTDASAMSQTILYARVSTTDQTTAHQRTQAEAAGFKIDDVVEDEGVSGVSTKLADRPGGRRLFDKLRRGDVLVVRWVDRLGRDYQDVTDTIREMMKRGIVVRTVINNLTFDGATTDPMQKAVRDALINFMAATAQAQADGVGHFTVVDPGSEGAP